MAIKEIKSHPGYWITEKGNLYTSRNKEGKRIKKTLSVNLITGRVQALVYLGHVEGKKKYKMLSIAREVAKAFIPNPNNHPLVLHKDNIITHNEAGNLKWGTYSENMNQAYRDKRIPRNKAICKLTPRKVRRIRIKFIRGASLEKLASAYGVKKAQILRIIKRESWKYT